MGKRKKVKQIEINPTELVPTTIGQIDTKESGPIFAIIWILIFAVGIFLLPFINDFLSGDSVPNETVTPPITEPPTQTLEPSEKDPEEDVEKEDHYYPYEKEVSIEIAGFTFDSFSISDSRIRFTITNTKGSSQEFKNNAYYLELYTNDKLLLQRIKLVEDNVTRQKNYEYSIEDHIDVEEIQFLSITKKDIKDYPAVTLNENASGLYTLTCQKEKEILTYSFVKEENDYQLVTLEENVSFSETEEDYEEKYEEYSSLEETYKLFEGAVSTDLSFLRDGSGFRFTNLIELEEINSDSYQKYFTKPIYYSLNTDARVIAFELESSGYQCD